MTRNRKAALILIHYLYFCTYMVALPAENDRHEPLPLDPLGKRLCLTFPYLWQPIVGVNEAKPNWQTVKPYPLRPRVLWRLWQDPAQLVGVRFDAQTRYGLIDIDQGSPYHPSHNPEALTVIRAALETIGIYRMVLVRSSWSEGLHFYIPLPEIVPTFALASTLKQCLEAQGLAIAQGQLEVFPNCKAYAIKGSYSEYNAHRLPLQPASGSYLLDDDGNPISQDLGQFFEQWDIAAAGQDMRELREAIATAKLNRKGKPHRQSTVIEEWRSDLRTEMEEGWTGHGQTNHLLKTIACYGVVFEGLSGNALVEFIHSTAIHAPGYFQWCRHQSEIQTKATVWARAAEGYYWRLGTEGNRNQGFHHVEAGTDPAAISMNVQRSEDAQRRIQEAVSYLETQGTLPATPTARAKAIAAQGLVSLKTLYRHPELWHPDHSDQADHSIGIERSCKTEQLELDVAIKPAEREAESRSLKSSDNGKFYTLEELMKGSPAEMGLLSVFSTQSFPQTPRRFPSRNFSVSDQPLLLSKSLSDGDSEFGMQLSFLPFQVNELISQSLVDLFTQDLLRKFCPWVLCRLLQLWQQGHAELMRALCQQHPDWEFQVNQIGLVEVGQDASEW